MAAGMVFRLADLRVLMMENATGAVKAVLTAPKLVLRWARLSEAPTDKKRVRQLVEMTVTHLVAAKVSTMVVVKEQAPVALKVEVSVALMEKWMVDMMAKTLVDQEVAQKVGVKVLHSVAMMALISVVAMVSVRGSVKADLMVVVVGYSEVVKWVLYLVAMMADVTVLRLVVL